MSSVEELRSDGRPGYHVRPALLMHVPLLWSSRAAETSSSAAASAITSRLLVAAHVHARLFERAREVHISGRGVLLAA